MRIRAATSDAGVVDDSNGRRPTMAGYSWETTPVEMQDESLGESRTVDLGGMTIAFERWKAPFDTTPLFKGLPDDSCQSPHWGFLFKGRFRVKTKDGEEAIEAGQAYYLAPGHIPIIDEDVEIVEFSPAQDRAATMEHVASVAAGQA
jgi:hypothetical protein